jgi:hypothetical protein
MFPYLTPDIKGTRMRIFDMTGLEINIYYNHSPYLCDYVVYYVLTRNVSLENKSSVLFIQIITSLCLSELLSSFFKDFFVKLSPLYAYLKRV